MKRKKIIKLAEKKLKKANKWIKEFKDYEYAHLEGTLEEVKRVRKICKLIIKHETKS